jgi:hypothetical protein
LSATPTLVPYLQRKLMRHNKRPVLYSPDSVAIPVGYPGLRDGIEEDDCRCVKQLALQSDLGEKLHSRSTRDVLPKEREGNCDRNCRQRHCERQVRRNHPKTSDDTPCLEDARTAVSNPVE